MEEEVGFEPTELLHPLVFKTSAINQALPFLLLFWSPLRESNPRLVGCNY